MKITREVAKELLPILKAFAEGKAIQDKIEGVTDWVDTDEINLEFEGQKILHRIKPKPEPKYRPFKNQAECWRAMYKQFNIGWIVNKDTKTPHHISSICTDCLRLDDGNTSLSFTDAFTHYEFPDGKPFGVKKR